MKELSGYPAPISLLRMPTTVNTFGGLIEPLRLATDAGPLSFFSTTTVFGTPVDVTLSELAIESFCPADEATARTSQQRLCPELAKCSQICSTDGLLAALLA